MKKIIKVNVFSIIFIGFILTCSFISNFIFKPIQINGPSMEPTLHDGSFHQTIRFSPIDRFDIVVATSSEQHTVIKRVIGLPNETIEYKNDNLYVNNKKVNEPYLQPLKNKQRTFTTDTQNQSHFKVTLKDDEYYLLGDNRPVSKDSRTLGPFKSNQIISKLLY